MQDYRPGEKVRVTVEATVHHVANGLMQLTYGDAAKPFGLAVGLDAPGATITRLVPAEGMPKVGELWESQALGRMLAIEAPYNKVVLGDGRSTFSLEEALTYGPMSRLYPTPEAMEFRERLAATPFPADDEPETVPIGGVSPGALVSTPDWYAGEPVRILSLKDTQDGQVGVRYQSPNFTGPVFRTNVAEDYPVTLFPVTPVSPEAGQ